MSQDRPTFESLLAALTAQLDASTTEWTSCTAVFLVDRRAEELEQVVAHLYTVQGPLTTLILGGDDVSAELRTVFVGAAGTRSRMLALQYDRLSGRHLTAWEPMSEMHWVSDPPEAIATARHVVPLLGPGSPNPRGLSPLQVLVEQITADLDETLQGRHAFDWQQAALIYSLNPGTRKWSSATGYVYNAEGDWNGASAAPWHLQGAADAWLDSAYPGDEPVPEKLVFQFDRGTGEVEVVEGDAKSFRAGPANMYAMPENLRPTFGPDRVAPQPTVKSDWYMGGTRVPMPLKHLFPHAHSAVRALGELLSPRPAAEQSWTLVAHLGEAGAVRDATGWTYPLDEAAVPVTVEPAAATEAIARYLGSTHKNALLAHALLVQMDASSGMVNLQLDFKKSDRWDAALASAPQKLRLTHPA